MSLLYLPAALTTSLIITTVAGMASDAVVSTPDGTLQGGVAQSRGGREYYAFKGIKYGNVVKRFALAQPVEPWTDIKNAIDFGPQCPHYGFVSPTLVSKEEDCLYLNVYTPKVASGVKKLPVMFWIHGGAFREGSASNFGADYLMDEDVILVTANYRLGILGFLNTQDGNTVANNGLKDLVLALKWVQRNIKAFGGDPEKVTLFGQSAGAASVHYLVLSPSTKGLFWRAIAQSGSALLPWAMESTPAASIKKVAERLGCSSEDSKDILECFEKQELEALLSAEAATKSPDTLTFVPSVETESSVEGDYVLIPATPFQLIENRKGNNVPFLVGSTTKEALLSSVGGLIANATALEGLRNNWASVSAKIFNYKEMVPQEEQAEFAEKLRSIYFGTKEISGDTADLLVSMGTDLFFTRGARLAAELHAFHGTEVFPYVFAYEGDFSLSSLMGCKDKGPGHSDDLQYLFACTQKPPKLYPDLKPGSKDEEFSRALVKLWVDFAAARPSSVAWKPLNMPTLEDVNYDHLILDSEFSLSQLAPEKFNRIIQVDRLMAQYENPRLSWRGSKLKDEL